MKWHPFCMYRVYAPRWFTDWFTQEVQNNGQGGQKHYGIKIQKTLVSYSPTRVFFVLEAGLEPAQAFLPKGF